MNGESFAKFCKRPFDTIIQWSRQRRDSLQQTIDPTFLRAKRVWHDSEAPCAALVCIYRSFNAAGVERLVSEATSLKMEVALWALDKTVPTLSAYTRGSGPGLRLALFNHLFKSLRMPAIEQLVVTDDDVSFIRGNLSQLLFAVKQCAFGIAQPAITRGWNHEFTKTRWLTLARLTSFVEVGPMFVVNQPWIERILPFPEEFGMGWGLDVVWTDLLSEGCRLGIVDSICLQHVTRTRGYDVNSELKRLKAVMKSRRVKNLAHIQYSLDKWRPWRSCPPWLEFPLHKTSPETEI